MRVDVGFERRRPLCGVFRITPAGPVRVDVGFGACPKGHRLGHFVFSCRSASFKMARLTGSETPRPTYPRYQRPNSQISRASEFTFEAGRPAVCLISPVNNAAR